MDRNSLAIIPSDLIPVKDACALIPSPRGKTALSTVYRLVRRGELRAWRRGPWTFVSRQEVVELMKPVQLPTFPRSKRENARAQKKEEERCKRVAAWLDSQGV